MLAQRELYSGSQETGLKIVQKVHINLYIAHQYFSRCINFTDSLKFLYKALYLRDFEDLLPVHNLYCLLALSALMCGAYGVASKV